MMLLLVEVCKMQNFEALEATSGRAALKLAVSEDLDLILLDWELPDITGVEVCRYLRRVGISAPILMLTGRTEDKDVVTGLEEGVDEYLTKPIRPQILAAKLAAHLRRASSEPDRPPKNAVAHLALLDRVSLFLHYSPAALRALAKRAASSSVRSGTAVLTQGAPNDSLFLIQKGSFEVTVRSPFGDRFSVARLGDAEFFGAISTLTRESAAATVTALEDSRLVRIPREDLLAELAPGSEAMVALESVVKQRRQILDRSQTRKKKAASAAQVVAMYSPKGGVGKTTLALNLAASLARKHPGEVLLVDCSLPYNHAAMLAQLVPTTSLARLADVTSGFEERVRSAMLPHPAGFRLLPTVLGPEEAELITPQLVSQALAELSTQFAFIVLDLGVALSEVTLSLLERSQAVFVVATAELLIVKDLISVYGILQDVLKLAPDQIHLVVNHRSAVVALGARELAGYVGVRVAVEIAHDGLRPENAAVRGEILAVSVPNSPIAKAADELSRFID
jgi:MinD-like ATPase involved in chromosome partitioning or flagellar assembly/CheY-like chemotaxis protein